MEAPLIRAVLTLRAAGWSAADSAKLLGLARREVVSELRAAAKVPDRPGGRLARRRDGTFAKGNCGGPGRPPAIPEPPTRLFDFSLVPSAELAEAVAELELNFKDVDVDDAEDDDDEDFESGDWDGYADE